MSSAVTTARAQQVQMKGAPLRRGTLTVVVGGVTIHGVNTR